jgi:hypothetical protein
VVLAEHLQEEAIMVTEDGCGFSEGHSLLECAAWKMMQVRLVQVGGYTLSDNWK